MANPRHQARFLALQALYQWELSGNDLRDIERQFMQELDGSKVDAEYFCMLLHGIPGRLTEVDAHFVPFLDRPLQGLDVVERVILRLSCYELVARLDVPYRVVLNEAVQLAKLFGGADGHKYVNGVLHQVAQQLRMEEVLAAKAPPEND